MEKSEGRALRKRYIAIITAISDEDADQVPDALRIVLESETVTAERSEPAFGFDRQETGGTLREG